MCDLPFFVQLPSVCIPFAFHLDLTPAVIVEPNHQDRLAGLLHKVLIYLGDLGMLFDICGAQDKTCMNLFVR